MLSSYFTERSSFSVTSGNQIFCIFQTRAVLYLLTSTVSVRMGKIGILLVSILKQGLVWLGCRSWKSRMMPKTCKGSLTDFLGGWYSVNKNDEWIGR